MCGRYAITSAPEAFRRLFGYPEQPNFPARYNVAPTQPIPIIRMDAGERHFALMRWGLIPTWAKDPKAVGLLINARGESVLEKPAFRNAMRRRRCLVPADGFFEWKAENGVKRPYFVRRRDGQPLAFAGLWETWTGPNGEEMDTAAIVTTSANDALRSIHDRMPVILDPSAFAPWLELPEMAAEAAAGLIAPAPEHLLELVEVAPLVNRVANDGPELIVPVSEGDSEHSAARAGSALVGTAGAQPHSKLARDERQGSLF